MSDDRTYAAAGVSLATAEGIVERLRKAAESTGAQAFGNLGFGAFAGLHPLDERRLLAASTDSIGTKPIVARRRGALRACGADMAAHCINDVITCGADPLILLDYVAANHIDLEQVADLVEGAAEVCRAAGVALIGGETAELPGVYREGELDFAATCVGIVDRDRVIDGSAVERGRLRDRPAVRGRARERIHARPLGARGRGLRRPRSARADAALPRRRPPVAGRGARVRARDRRRDRRQSQHASSRTACAPSSTGTPGSGRRCSSWLGRHVEEEEARRVFNLGIGYCAVVPEPGEDLVIGRIVAA